jgi:dienelactone hydrolase
MAIEVQCAECAKRFVATDKWAGRRVQCPACGGTIEIPAPAAEVEPLESLSPPPLNTWLEGELPSGRTLPNVPPPSIPSLSASDQPPTFSPRKDAVVRGLGVRINKLLGAVFAVVVVILILGLKIGKIVNRMPKPPMSAAAWNRDLATIPLPSFPERGPLRTLQPGVEAAEVRLDVPADQPGKQNLLYVYLPSGPHPPRSLPCVLIAPAGTPLICGIALGDGDRAEHAPYVQAGFAVVAYELDGPLDNLEHASDAQVRAAFEDFARAQAGLVNARNALEYVLQRLPEVDPERIYVAGHSSAGTTALLVAAHEPRIRGCLAYAPCTDPEASMQSARQTLDAALPGAWQFIIDCSPLRHEAQLQCPVFLFHASDDSNVPVQETQSFSNGLRQLGKTVTLEVVPSGDHYDSMISQGIPRGIQWLKSLDPRNANPGNRP